MSKYKLINKQTNQEHLCNKVTIDDGFDYYVSNEGYFKHNDLNVPSDFSKVSDISITKIHNLDIVNGSRNGYKKVIACNNPNIDIPKVVDEVEKIAEEWFLINGYNQFDYIHSHRIPDAITTNKLFKTGYKESQKTYSNSDEDMKSFGKFCIENNFCKEENRYYQYWEMLKLWKEQQPKIVYYV